LAFIKPCKADITILFSAIQRNNIINANRLFRLLNPQPLLVASPKVEEHAKRRQLKPLWLHVHLHSREIVKAGKDGFVAYPPRLFFAEAPFAGALVTFRAVPLNMASEIASLYAASSSGDVRSSTSS
jgi:hypothetical protein